MSLLGRNKKERTGGKTIRIRQIDKLGDILDKSVTVGANTINGVTKRKIASINPATGATVAGFTATPARRPPPWRPRTRPSTRAASSPPSAAPSASAWWR